MICFLTNFLEIFIAYNFLFNILQTYFDDLIRINQKFKFTTGLRWNVQYGRIRIVVLAIVTERFSSEIARQIGPRDVYGQIARNAIV